MEADREAGAGLTGLAPPLKRKKTVTWAEDDELELPLGPPGGAEEGGTAAAAAAPVVVLPCDGLYDALAADLLEQQEELPAAAGEEPLSRRQLLERRLAHTEQLACLYEGELWALAEELRLRHTQFVAQRGQQAVWAGSAGTPAGSEGQQQQQQSEEEEDTEMADAEAEEATAGQQEEEEEAGSKPAAEGENAAVPGAALRALWEARHQQQGAAPDAQGSEQQAGGEQDVKQQQQGAGKQQAEGKPEGKPGKKGDKAAGKRGGQAAGKDGGGKAAKPEGRQAAKDKQQAGAGGGDKQAARQAGGRKQAAPKDAPADVAAEQQPAAAAQEGGAAAGAAAEPAAAPVQLPPLPPQPRFEDIEALVLSGAAGRLPPVDEAALVEARARFVRRLDLLGRLEQSALSAAARQLDTLGGLALLCGRRCRYIVRRSAVAIGRSSGSQGKVDVDLALEGGAAAQRVSRHQAQLWLEADGGFRLRCTGRRPMWVNGRRVEQGQAAPLPTLSHVAVGGVSLLFVANVAAAQRGAARAAALLAP